MKPGLSKDPTVTLRSNREEFPCDEDDGSGVTMDHAWAEDPDAAQCSHCGWTRHELRARAAEPRICGECGRLRSQPKPPEPVEAIMHCAECHVPFSLDEIGTMFHAANMSDGNSARQLRRVIVDDLIAALRTKQLAAVTP